MNGIDDGPETEIKKLCCTCLSKDRKLFQLCRLPDGVNNLYLLLSFDSEAYREGFYKDTASLYICWECKAIMFSINRFRKQACTAQRILTTIADGRTDIQTICLSRLTTNNPTTYDKINSEFNNTLTDNFIDCGPATDIKSESEEDIPLAQLHNNWLSENSAEIIPSIDYIEEFEKETFDSKKDPIHEFKKVKIKKRKKFKNGKKNMFSIVLMNDAELEEKILTDKMATSILNSEFKCENCVERFQSQTFLDEHNFLYHREKPDHLQCDICLVFIKFSSFQEHREAHYYKYLCKLCEYITYNIDNIMEHLKIEHGINEIVHDKRKKGIGKNTEVLKPGSKLAANATMMDKKTPYGYLCTECNKYFDNKNQRWKHVQRHHREGYKCSTCGKRFAFKNNLNRHEQLHKGPPPRQECEICHKMIRVDLIKVHLRIHSNREQYHCVECAKRFVSRASYEHHLKYTQPHAREDILKHKCTMCDKGYRSQGELRDHVNYQHLGKTQHKCPVCGKALATRRCITRHVRRAHDGIKESARDKICQQCGKAFRDKKGLREHELIHSGERPLSCEVCGATFRQSASLYTHRKRVHRIYTHTKRIVTD